MAAMDFPQRVYLSLHTAAPAPGEATEVSGGYRRQPLETQGDGHVFELPPPPLDQERVYRGLWTDENGGTLIASAALGEDLTADGVVIE